MSLYRLLTETAFSDGDIENYQEVELAPPLAYLKSESLEDGAGGVQTLSESFDRLLPSRNSPAQVAQRAEALLAQARAQAEGLRQAAREEGLAQGREEGKQELLVAAAALAEGVEGLIRLERRLVSDLAPNIVRLALEIAEKLVGKAVTEDPEIVASVLERAKKDIPESRCSRIWLHPEDYRLLQGVRPDLLENMNGETLQVISSDEIGRGGCRVETDMGTVDATLKTQLEETRDQLLDKTSR
jgi:flagellar biosynthesis/type III secretory pathway protein FliH